MGGPQVALVFGCRRGLHRIWIFFKLLNNIPGRAAEAATTITPSFPSAPLPLHTRSGITTCSTITPWNSMDEILRICWSASGILSQSRAEIGQVCPKLVNVASMFPDVGQIWPAGSWARVQIVRVAASLGGCFEEVALLPHVTDSAPICPSQRYPSPPPPGAPKARCGHAGQMALRPHLAEGAGWLARVRRRAVHRLAEQSRGRFGCALGGSSL